MKDPVSIARGWGNTCWAKRTDNKQIGMFAKEELEGALAELADRSTRRNGTERQFYTVPITWDQVEAMAKELAERRKRDDNS